MCFCMIALRHYGSIRSFRTTLEDDLKVLSVETLKRKHLYASEPLEGSANGTADDTSIASPTKKLNVEVIRPLLTLQDLIVNMEDKKRQLNEWLLIRNGPAKRDTPEQRKQRGMLQLALAVACVDKNKFESIDKKESIKQALLHVTEVWICVSSGRKFP